MMHINRSYPSLAFQDFLHKEHPTVWDEFTSRRSLYSACRDALVKDQHGLSAYTELKLDLKNHKAHIDHFRKRALYNQPRKHIFDWYNFVVDNHNPNYGADHKDKMVHTVEGNEKLVDPIHESPEHYFEYDMAGQILPSEGLTSFEKEKAEFTIESFNLNHRSLVEIRSEISRVVSSYLEAGLDKNEITEALQDEKCPTFVRYVLDNVCSDY